ncbi:MAG: hypothetical protein IJN54_03015 [Lachnospiraceae bacterium]|nr:hypothetical protein [Lachnospiraceae bacterium]
MTDYSKNRVLALYKILTKYTDELHQISMQDILVHMEAEGLLQQKTKILTKKKIGIEIEILLKEIFDNKYQVR